MARTRHEYEQDVSFPGKFEQEAPYVPYFWDCYLDGGADYDDGDTLTFVISEQDRVMFPELETDQEIRLRELDNGFVVEV